MEAHTTLIGMCRTLQRGASCGGLPTRALK